MHDRGATRPLSPNPVDWATTRRVARLVAGRDAIHDSYLGHSLEGDFAIVTEEAEALVADFTGLSAPGRARAAVLDRGEWVDANVRSMRRMLEPVTRRIGERLARNRWSAISRHVAGGEMGVLLGFLAQRVLGQYDLLLADEEADAGDAVYFVGPNVLSLEKRFAFRPLDFRRWIAIHELTHRAQFTGVPWMRDYFVSLVRESLDFVDPDPRVLVDALRRAADEVRAGRNPLDGAGIVGLLATPEQRRVLDRVQALMSFLEGHGNVVMDEVGREHVTGAERMARVLHRRRRAGGLTGMVQKLLGLEMKMRQYEVGERFVRGVEHAAGLDAVGRAFASPEMLPSLEELEDPDAWLHRVDGAVPARSRPVAGGGR